MAKPKVKFINPVNILRQKVGYGGLEAGVIEKAETYIDKNKIDFAPIAETILARLDDHVRKVKTKKMGSKEARQLLIAPIMELKANGGMFKYMLVSEIADVVMNFLENIEELDDDAMDIVRAHQSALRIILANKLSGDGGVEGRALANELYKACLRYYNKYEIEPKG